MLSTCDVVFLIFLFFCYCGFTIQDACQHGDLLLRNGTVWKTDPCTTCNCISLVPVCKSYHCRIPDCPPNTVLSSIPQECCLQCLQKPRSCFDGGTEIQHDTKWSPSHCTECQCHNGSITCSRTQCQITGCPESKVAVQTQDDCCPKCIATGRYCRKGSEVHDDGTTWHPTPCSMCQCQNGIVHCYVEQCLPTSCLTNSTLILKRGKCCPECEGAPCINRGIIHSDGENWKMDPCTTCSCTAGRVSCHRSACPKLECRAESEVKYTPPGECCQICVSKSGWCELDKEKRIPAGVSIKPTEGQCQSNNSCFCFDGKIKCSELICHTNECYPNQRLSTLSVKGTCQKCPKCVPDMRHCYYGGIQRQDGDTWKVGCHVCTCKVGKMTCFFPSCSSCPPGHSRMVNKFHNTLTIIQDRSTCCPKCVPNMCPSKCSTCSSEEGESRESLGTLKLKDGVFCTSCQRGLYLDNGTCVHHCQKGTYAKFGECKRCHKTCNSCADRTKFHCTSCRNGSVLRRGQCVDHCGSGFYLKKGGCHQCHSSCQECTGSGAKDCQLCDGTAKLFEGSCLPTCPEEHIARLGVCEKCLPSCLQCGFKECLQCQKGLWQQDGHCVAKCQVGYYKGPANKCLACHPSCLSCNGPGAISCTSCPNYLQQFGSSCLTTCPSATFSYRHRCHECHSSCIECLKEGPDGCLECRDQGKLILPKSQLKGDIEMPPTKGQVTNGNIGSCVVSCPLGFDEWLGKCIGPPSGCRVWHPSDGTVCLECDEGLFLVQGSCRTKCPEGFYANQMECHECDPHCLTCHGPGYKSCQECPPWASLHQRAMKGQLGTSSKCLTKCRERHYYLPDDSSCRTCHFTCQECAVRERKGPPICSKCKNTDHYLEGGECVHACSEGKYLSNEEKQCLSCHPSCKTCGAPGPNQCLSCYSDVSLSKEGVCSMKKCQTDSTMSDEVDCQTCERPCRTCQDRHTCLTCLPGKHLLSGKCLDNCPTMFYSDTSKNGDCMKCHWDCSECRGGTANDCITCGTSRLRQEVACVERCSKGFFEERRQCQSCPGGCQECLNDNSCEKCRSPYFLQNGLCVVQCSDGTYSNEWENICVDCNRYCDKCNMFDCLSCKESHLLQNGQCVTECDADYLTDEDNTTCYYNAKGPTLYVMGVITAEVGDITVLNSSLLQIHDSDTPKEALRLVLRKLPSNGALAKLDGGNAATELRENQEIEVGLIEEGRIVFKPKVHKDSFSEIRLQVSDGTHKSDLVTVYTKVVSKYPPIVTTSQPIIVQSNGEVTVTEENIEVTDFDNINDVEIRILDPSSSGKFTVGGNEIETFSNKDVSELMLSYKAKPSTSPTKAPKTKFSVNQQYEMVVLQATDHINFVNFLIEIVVVDSEQPAPVLVRNRGADVEVNGKIQITSDFLKAKDIDSGDENVIFSVIPSFQNEGKLVLVIPKPSIPSSMFLADGWIQMDESHLLRPTTSFTQRDINEGRVWFVHDAEGSGFPKDVNPSARNIYADDDSMTQQLVFSVSDSSQPPNILGDQAFIIKVISPGSKRGDSPSDSQMGLTVYEGQAVTLSPNHLSFAGVNSSDHLVYTITRPLGYQDGSLFHIDSPGLELRQFTQSDINDMKIIYMPPFEDVDDFKVISFKFMITDETNGHRKEFGEHQFTIRVLSLNVGEMTFILPDPEISVSTLGTVELESKYIHLDNLPEELVNVYMLEAPSYGSVIVFPDAGQPETFTEDSEYSYEELLKCKIVYSNDGSPSSSDSVHLLALSHSSEATTRIELKIYVEDTFITPPSQHNATLTMALSEMKSKIISSKILHAGDLQSNSDELVYTITSQPQLGNIIRQGPLSKEFTILNKTNAFSQKEVSEEMISYVSKTEIGLQDAVDQIYFDVLDQHNRLSKMVLEVTVMPVDNQSPQLEIRGAVAVKEGGRITLPHTLFVASDMDTTASKIQLQLDVPPLFGFIANAQMLRSESSSTRSNAIEFPLLDFLEGKMVYVQSQHRHQEPLKDSFMAHLTDGAQDSPVRKVSIDIEPMDDEPPVVLGEQVRVGRGQTVIISNTSLFIADIDSPPSKLILKVLKLPKAGSLHKKKDSHSSVKESVGIFLGDQITFQDILRELVFYSHDGSKGLLDGMEIMVSDGHQETGAMVEFLVHHSEDKLLRMSIIEEWDVTRGQGRPITSKDLSANNQTSLNDNVLYTITVPASHGRLLLLKEDWTPLSLGSSFLQQDINDGRIKYINDGDEDFQDKFEFNIQDQEGNTLLDQGFNIRIVKDMHSPTISVNRKLIIEEGIMSSTISSKHLSASDAEVENAKLQFKLLSEPMHGILQSSHRGSEPINQWTQENIDNDDIKYVPKKDCISENDTFQFSVSDGVNSVNGTFAIEILYLDKFPPSLTTSVIKAQEGVRRNITRYDLNVEDPDTSDDNISIQIMRKPEVGHIQAYSDGRYLTIESFTMADIHNEKISYLPGKFHTSEDSFSIKVSDPFQVAYVYRDSLVTESTTVEIEISNAVEGAPLLIANRGIRFLSRSNGKALHFISSNNLKIVRGAAPGKSLKYVVVSQPKEGVLRLSSRERPVAEFTQEMIDNNQLYYELIHFNKDVFEDEFTFRITNNSDNNAVYTFHIEWSWTYMTKRVYNINENQRVVQIFIKRNGHLKQRSSASCSINSLLSAKAHRNAKDTGSDSSFDDFVPVRLTVEFLPGALERYCEIAIVNDDIYEGTEWFNVILVDADKSLIAQPSESKIILADNEDKPSISFESNNYSYSEDEKKLFVPVRRIGDPSIAASVLCITEDRTAISYQKYRSNYTDYISRRRVESSTVVFPPGVKVSMCEVQLIDDSHFEIDEVFHLLLVNASKNALIGAMNVTSIEIIGQNDQSLIRFRSLEFEASENFGKVDILMHRTSSDLSHSASVWCASRDTTPPQAKSGIDFVPFSKHVRFEAGQKEAGITITILDDEMKPEYEGPESFEVFLSTPENASISDKESSLIITILDEEDIPTIEFGTSEFKVEENDNPIRVPVIRDGDLKSKSTVRCSTKQKSAKAGIDFRERPNTLESEIVFLAGLQHSYCEVILLDDPSFEKKEEFILKLSHPDSQSSPKPKIGLNRTVRITITDPEDKPRMFFENAMYNFLRSDIKERDSVVQISIRRIGDKTKSSKIRITAKDESAVAGKDFHIGRKTVEFGRGVERVNFNVSILDTTHKDLKIISFRLVMSTDQKTRPNSAGYTSTTVTIAEYDASETSVLPSPPIAMSLLYYDNAKNHINEPASPGYPLVCISSCEKRHPNYQDTKDLCEKAGIQEDTLMKYLWEIASPDSEDAPITTFHRMTDPSLYAGVASKVLDSMYFAKNFNIRCIAQPLFSGNQLGIPLQSDAVTISSSFGICHKEKQGFPTQSFTAKLTYANSSAVENPNTIEMMVSIPHQDGMVPLFSTLPLHNIEYLLTDEIHRAHHFCSNMNFDEGFLSAALSDAESLKEELSRPYQWDRKLRSATTLLLYQHLDLTTCSWNFTTYYSMSQLVDKCGGQIVADFQVGKRGQSFLTVRLPLYLSYVFASPAPSWTSLDHRTELSVSLHYSTLLWQQGLYTEPSLTAQVQVTRVFLNKYGLLVVELTTMAKFQGQFVMSHPNCTELLSRLVPPQSLNILMKLELLWSAPTWDGPEQAWRATSDYTLKDYTGNYSLQLIPCTMVSSQIFSSGSPLDCQPHPTVNFSVPLSIQQTQRPLPAVYTLNTEFQLLSSPRQFVMDPSRADPQEVLDYKGSFGAGQVVYGRVLLSPTQSLHSTYELVIRKLFICAGVDGYIPKYDPTGDIYNEGPQYGCVLPTNKLLHRFLVLDRERSHFIGGNATISPIEAYFASEYPEYHAIDTFPEVDGFLLMTDSLYKVRSGNQWFLQVLYTIGPRTISHIDYQKSRRRKDTDKDVTNLRFHSTASSVTDVASTTGKKRSPVMSDRLLLPLMQPPPNTDFLQSLHTRNGTNLRALKLSQVLPAAFESGTLAPTLVYAISSILLLLLAIGGALFYFRRRSSPPGENVVVVRSAKNERAQAINRVEVRTSGDKYLSTLIPPVTLNSESNLHTIKVKTLAVTVRNNLDEDGTEV